MRVRIGSIEIFDVSLDDLEEIIRRYGRDPESETDWAGSPETNASSRASMAKGSTTDTVLLKKFVEAGSLGVTTNDVGEMLGRRGKATRGAAREWARRVQLTTDDSIDPFEDCRNGTNRAIRIKSSLMDVAKAHLNSK